MLKAELRQIYLARQKALSPAERRGASQRIAGLFFENFDLSAVRFLNSFLPIERFREIDTRLIVNRLWSEFPRIETSAPRVDFSSGEIESLRFAPGTVLTRNRWQIEEPGQDEKIAAENLDLILVPLLCFDLRGYRVGYGKGFYDRFLKNCRPDCLKIGLGYFAPVEKIEDAQSFDRKLDFCVTPLGMFETENGKWKTEN